MGVTGSTQVSTTCLPIPRDDMRKVMEEQGFVFGQIKGDYINVVFPDDWTLVEGQRPDFDRWEFFLLDPAGNPRYSTWEIYKVGGYDPPLVHMSFCPEESWEKIKEDLQKITAQRAEGTNPDRNIHEESPMYKMIDALSTTH